MKRFEAPNTRIRSRYDEASIGSRSMLVISCSNEDSLIIKTFSSEILYRASIIIKADRCIQNLEDGSYIVSKCNPLIGSSLETEFIYPSFFSDINNIISKVDFVHVILENIDKIIRVDDLKISFKDWLYLHRNTKKHNEYGL